MQPMILGHSLTDLVLYFFFYSFAGWVMETTYCSISARRFVARGFLHGPVCPIYGVGVLLMVLFFRPLAGNVLLFYVVSTVCMSAWEYFVGWFLEITTHTKYWDYSNYRFNLHGRICLWVCLMWGVLSYVCVFWVHPPVAQFIDTLPLVMRNVLAIVLTVVILADAIITIRELALMTRVLNKLQEGREKLKAKYDELITTAERRTRRFRRNYSDFRALRLDSVTLHAIGERARQATAERQEKKAAKKRQRKMG